MNQALIFEPIGVLVGLTYFVAMLMMLRRFQAAHAGRMSIGNDLRLGESKNVPEGASLPNRNYMNLLEMPVLFYVICIMLYVSKRVTDVQLYLAWGFVVVRVLHSAVHLTVNNVFARLAAFFVAGSALMVMWLLFFFG